MQAGIIHGEARAMVIASPELRSRCRVYQRAITAEATGSSYHVLSADAETKHGSNPHGIIFDEVHVQPNRDLWDVLQTGQGARRQPLTFAATTAGFDRNSLCWELHDYACKVRDGIIEDDTFLPVIFSAEPEDDWQDPATWAKANPSLGETIKLDYLEREAKRASEVPGYENTFKRLHLNLWTEQETRWLAIEDWNKCARPFDPDVLKGTTCYGGLDLGRP